MRAKGRLRHSGPYSKFTIKSPGTLLHITFPSVVALANSIPSCLGICLTCFTGGKPSPESSTTIASRKLSCFYIVGDLFTINAINFQEKIADANLIAKWKKQGYENLCCLRCIQVLGPNDEMEIQS